MKDRRPSAAMIVAVVALVFSLAGVGAAGVVVSKLSKKEKKQTRVIADKEVKKLAPKLSVKSAGSAVNADQLGGRAAGDYALAHSRGIALAGGWIESNGTVRTWFNTLGGKPTVTKYNGNAYDITFPGLSNPLQTVPLATPYATNLGAEATTSPFDSGVTVQTFNASGSGAPNDFFVVVYDASPAG